MSDGIRQAAQAAAQNIQANAPAPAAPAPPPQVAPPGGAPQAPAPNPVQYVAPTAMAQVTVDGKKMDVPVSDLVRKYQVGSAAEQRLQQANQLADRYRGDLDAVARIRSLANSNPQAALEEARRSLGLQLPPKASDNPQSDADADPQTTRLQSEVAQLKASLEGLNQFREQLTTDSVKSQIAATVREFPLYAADPKQAARAEYIVAAYMQANPQASLREVAGLVHADDADFVQRQFQATRDQRAGNIQQFAHVPPSAGTPQLTQPEMPRMTKEQMSGKSLPTLKGVAAEIRRMAGM